MAFPRPTPAATAFFQALLPEHPEVRVKPMFGCQAAFAREQMFLGTFGDEVFLRLPEDARETLMELSGARAFEPLPGRVMVEYVLLPRAFRDELERARPWVERSLEQALAAPARARRSRAGRPR